MEHKESDFDYDYIEYKYGVDLKENAAAEQIGNSDDETDDERLVNSAKMELYDWVQCLVAALLCGILLFVFVGRIIGVDGTSMLQTLQNKDKVVMSNLFYTPEYGDIVLIKTDFFGDTPIVNRIIATAGHHRH
jgi:signal peptidase I